MYNNDLINIKARFETLFDTKLKDTVYKGTEKYTLEDLILSLTHGPHNLFIAIEQGSGKYQNHTNVIINLLVREQARN